MQNQRSARNDRSRDRFGELPAILLILALILGAGAFLAAGIWFAIPREPAIPAGYTDDYAWNTPEYVALRSDLAVFLDRDGDKIVALDATSPTSQCRIRWVSGEGQFIDPCCGARWARDGSPVERTSSEGKNLTRYQVEVTADGRIMVFPWRVLQPEARSGC